MAPPVIKMEAKPTLGVVDLTNNNNNNNDTNNDINQELTNEYEFVGNIDYLKSKSKFGEECLGRRCLILFDIKPKPKKYKPKSKTYRGGRRRTRSKGLEKPRPKGTVPSTGRVVAYRKQMVDPEETELDEIEFQAVHLIKFDEDQEPGRNHKKEDDEETPEVEWWMDLNELRDRGELFWVDHVIQRVAVKRRKKKSITPPKAEGEEGKEEEPKQEKEPEQPELPPEILHPKWPVGSEVFWHLVQPTKPGEEPEVPRDPNRKLTQLPQPSGLDLSGFVEEVPLKENDYQYKVSIPGEYKASVLLPPSAILRGKKKRKERPPRKESAKRPKIPTLPWIEGMMEWMISVPTAKTETSKARVMTHKSAKIVVAKAKLLASGKGIAYGKWTENAAGDDEHSKNLTVFYKDQPLPNLAEYDYETARSDGAAHELLYGKDDSSGWLYSYTLTKIYQFQQYCIHHGLDMEAPPSQWQDLPGSQEPAPLPETPIKSPKKKKENSDSAQKLKSSELKAAADAAKAAAAAAKAALKAKENREPFFAISANARGFLASQMGITTYQAFLGTKTSDIANEFVAWREQHGMKPLQGNGTIATVSGWKALVRKRINAAVDEATAQASTPATESTPAPASEETNNDDTDQNAASHAPEPTDQTADVEMDDFSGKQASLDVTDRIAVDDSSPRRAAVANTTTDDASACLAAAIATAGAAAAARSNSLAQLSQQAIQQEYIKTPSSQQQQYSQQQQQQQQDHYNQLSLQQEMQQQEHQQHYSPIIQRYNQQYPLPLQRNSHTPTQQTQQHYQQQQYQHQQQQQQQHSFGGYNSLQNL